ncbi:hypothetical protein [uncultured Dokdonia sp.]|uniref:hypothetical protein n=1 Tax=uncultured Dokdonia sp. TaxID=575653 RepID=UPI002606C9BA|nr:hypothetical protein [uncultured Dokdonia sp.]
MNVFYFIVAIFISFPIYSQTQEDLNAIRGVEIYLFKEICNNPNSFYKLPKEKQDQLFNDYDSFKEFPVEYCPDYINLKKCNLQEDPFLLGSDIKSFNWNTKTLVLSEEGKSKLSTIKFKYFGAPFSLKIKGEHIFNAWFWSIGSSQICSRVYGKLMPNTNSINLRFAKGFGCGPNPLEDENITAKIVSLQHQN